SLVKIDNQTRVQARQQAAVVQQVAQQRTKTEVPVAPGAARQARVASFSVPKTQPVKPGMVAPRAATPPASASTMRPVTPAPKAAASTTTNPAAGRATPGAAARPGTGSLQPASRWVPTTTGTPGRPGTPTAPGTNTGPAARTLPARPNQPPPPQR